MSEGRRFVPVKAIKNWSAYNKGLEKRYDITVHINPQALEKPSKAEGKRGRSPVTDRNDVGYKSHLSPAVSWIGRFLKKRSGPKRPKSNPAAPFYWLEWGCVHPRQNRLLA